MEIGEIPTQTLQEPVGKKKYEVEKTNIEVKWKPFSPTEKTEVPRSQEDSRSKKAVAFIPGWSITEQAKSIETLCQAFADYSHAATYAIDTRAKQIVPDSLTKEAEAVRRFIQEKGLENVTLVGNSLGGMLAIHLTALLQKENPNIDINGLILLDSTSLYNQTDAQLAANYLRDMLNTQMGLRHPPRMMGSDELAAQNSKYMKDGTVEILKEIMRSNIRFPHRTFNKIQGMTKTTPHLAEIKSPVVLIQGAQDLLANPKKIIPTQDSDSQQQREQFLKKYVFPNSPYVRMVVPWKMGYHNVPYSRPASVAQSSLYLLERWHRQQAH